MAKSSENSSNTDTGFRPEGNHSGGQRNSLPLVLSGIAVLIAALALIANQMGQPEPRIDPLNALNGKLGQIEARLGDMESQLTSDKLDGVSLQLKRIQFELEQLALLADKDTRQRIDQALDFLKPLSELSVKVQAEVDVQSLVAPENQTTAEESATPLDADALQSPEQVPAPQNDSATPLPDDLVPMDAAPEEGEVSIEPDATQHEPMPLTPEKQKDSPANPQTPATNL
ncbi:MAG: hypothetical protein Q9M23_01990 [Mariprofundaceae bacterium]|nr:hypothetical protein [Mariprofundaceae bacterium]